MVHLYDSILPSFERALKPSGSIAIVVVKYRAFWNALERTGLEVTHERLIDLEVDEELSLGDFVLSGGEIAAMAVIDAVARLLPGVLGDDESAIQDSFMDGLLDHPHYTRPESIEGHNVPSVLLSGDHARIARWRYKQALGRSFLRRPDLVEKLDLSSEQQAVRDEFLKEQGQVRMRPSRAPGSSDCP